MPYAVKDNQVKVTKALSAGAGTVYSDGVDLGHNSTGEHLTPMEFLLSAPALTTAELPNAETMTYTIQHDSDAEFGTVEDLYDAICIQTGADGAGAAAAEKRIALPSDVKRYIRVTAVNSGAGDASGKSLTFEGVF